MAWQRIPAGWLVTWRTLYTSNFTRFVFGLWEIIGCLLALNFHFNFNDFVVWFGLDGVLRNQRNLWICKYHTNNVTT